MRPFEKKDKSAKFSDKMLNQSVLSKYSYKDKSLPEYKDKILPESDDK